MPVIYLAVDLHSSCLCFSVCFLSSCLSGNLLVCGQDVPKLSQAKPHMLKAKLS